MRDTRRIDFVAYSKKLHSEKYEIGGIDKNKIEHKKSMLS